MENVTPRVNGELLGRFVGRKVLLVGRQEGANAGVLQLRTSDNRLVQIALKSGAGLSEFLEFECVVQSNESVTEVEHTCFAAAVGELFSFSRHTQSLTLLPDLGNYDSLVKLIHSSEQRLFF